MLIKGDKTVKGYKQTEHSLTAKHYAWKHIHYKHVYIIAQMVLPSNRLNALQCFPVHVKTISIYLFFLFFFMFH